MFVQVIWDEDDEPDGNVAHIAEHDLTKEEVEDVLLDDTIPAMTSKETGSPCKFGWTSTGRHIIVIWLEVEKDPRIIRPVTAYEVPEKRR